jgi:hypothetical protein
MGLALLFASLTTALLLNPPAGAQSIGISPGVVEVTDALRGSDYTRTFTVLNQRTTRLVFQMSVSGEAADWVTLYDSADRTTPAERIEVPPETNKDIVVQIAIPDDAPNQRFVAEITLGSPEPEPGETLEAGAAVTTGLALDVVVDVTGTERLQGDIVDVVVRDTEVGLPLRAKMDFINTGNVIAEPVVGIALSDAGGQVVGETTVVQEVVPLEERTTLKAELDTSTRQPGPYTALVTVELRDQEVYSQPFEIEIFPEGTFAREGELVSLTLANAPYPGAIANLVAEFQNSGEVDMAATFEGEVFKDGDLIGTAASDEVMVEAGNGTQLEVLVDVLERGKYRVQGHVNYEGKSTQDREVSFKVPPDLSEEATLFGRPWWQVLIAILAVAAILLVVIQSQFRRTKVDESG